MSERKLVVFYSWQSWTNQKINRYFIQESIQETLDRLRNDTDFLFDCALDRDTKNLPGTPAIADAILKKIEQCDIFICDLTITTMSSSESNEIKASPNPNVLLELGYAAAKIGWDRIISIMNESYGSADLLPFDLQHRRHPITYSLRSETDRKLLREHKAILSRAIESAIRNVVQVVTLRPSLHPKDMRVLEELEHALYSWNSQLISFFARNLTTHEHNPLDRLEQAIKEGDINFLRNPSEDYLNSIIDFFSDGNLIKTSPNYSGKKKWSEEIAGTLISIYDSCNSLLQRYADREEVIISLVEDTRKSSRQLAELINAGWSAGMSRAFTGSFQWFLAVFLQSYSVILEYNGRIWAYDDSEDDDFYAYYESDNS